MSQVYQFSNMFWLVLVISFGLFLIAISGRIYNLISKNILKNERLWKTIDTITFSILVGVALTGIPSAIYLLGYAKNFALVYSFIGGFIVLGLNQGFVSRERKSRDQANKLPSTNPVHMLIFTLGLLAIFIPVGFLIAMFW